MLSALRLLLAMGTALLAIAGWKAWVSRRGHVRNAVRHALRLSDDIAAIAETIEADLVRLNGQPAANPLRARCRECRERADDTFAQRRVLGMLDADALEERVELLHDDHRRVVNLRSEVDSALAGAARPNGSRIYSYARSRYPSSSYPTRPSTLM
jgi:hypothetical protein